jgi:hypothetical protein
MAFNVSFQESCAVLAWLFVFRFNSTNLTKGEHTDIVSVSTSEVDGMTEGNNQIKAQ